MIELEQVVRLILIGGPLGLLGGTLRLIWRWRSCGHYSLLDRCCHLAVSAFVGFLAYGMVFAESQLSPQAKIAAISAAGFFASEALSRLRKDIGVNDKNGLKSKGCNGMGNGSDDSGSSS